MNVVRVELGDTCRQVHTANGQWVNPPRQCAPLATPTQPKPAEYDGLRAAQRGNGECRYALRTGDYGHRSLNCLSVPQPSRARMLALPPTPTKGDPESLPRERKDLET